MASDAIVTNDLLVITRLTNWQQQASCGYPLGGAHDKVLSFDGSVTNTLAGTDHTGDQWLDLLVAPVRWNGGLPPVIADDQMVALYVDSNGKLNVAHGADQGWGYSNVWTTIDSVTLEADEWLRATVHLRTIAEESFYSLTIDGGWPLINQWAYTTASTISPSGGEWFPCINFQLVSGVTALSLNGTGHLDDYVVTNQAPAEIVESDKALFIADDDGSGYGGISPSSNLVVEVSAGTNFIVQAVTNYHIVTLLLNGAPVFDFSAVQSNSYTLAWSNGQFAVNTLYAAFAEDLTTNRVPVPWLAGYYFTNDFVSAAMSDTDGDGLLAWQEYLAGCIPTNAASDFRIVQMTVTNGNCQIIFTGAFDQTRDLPPFRVERCTDLKGAWGNVDLVPRSGAVNGTNIWSGGADAADGEAHHYRIRAVGE